MSGTDEAGENGDPARAMARILMEEQYQGAFPHPSSLRDFDNVVSNGAERAFALTEREQTHRHGCDNKIIDAEIDRVKSECFDRRLLIILAFVSIILGMTAAVVLTSLDKPVGAGVIGGASLLVGIGSAVFYRNRPGPATPIESTPSKQ